MRQHLRAGLALLSLLLGLGAVPSALATTTTLTFDDLPNGELITQYQGIGVTASGVAVLNAAFTPWPARSAPNLAYAPSGLMTFNLNPAITGDVQTVSAYLSGQSVGMYAYDAAGVLVGQASTPTGGHNVNNMLLSVTSSGKPIVSVTIHDGGATFAIDDLSFATASTVPLASFSPALTIIGGSRANSDSFLFGSPVTLGASGKTFDPAVNVVSLQIGALTTTIPAGSFKPNGLRGFAFHGLIGGVNLIADIQPLGANKYLVGISGTGASLTGIVNPIPVTLTIGSNTGSKPVKATIILPQSIKGLFNNPFGR